LGVDIGGVIIERTDESDDTSFWGDNYLATPAMPGAFEALRELRERRFGAGLFVVSKSSAYTEWRAHEWLEHHAFHERTGVPRENIHFCRQRADKAGIARDLRLTHFVDDRIDVLRLLADVPHRYLLGPAGDAEVPVGVLPVETWQDAARAIFVDGA
jgi:hypothetical protein